MTEIIYQEIQETLRLEELLDDLGIPVVRATSRGWQNTSCPLPTHAGQDVNPSFGVNEDSCSFNCFSCDESGTMVKLAMLLKELDYDSALEYVLGFTDLDFDIDNDTEFIEMIDRNLEHEPSPIIKRQAIVLPYFDHGAIEQYQWASLELLERWHIKKLNTIKAFNLRFDPKHERAGYIGPALIIPHYVNGDLVGWQERWLDDNRPKHIPKYTNTSDFPREETVFNQDRAKNMKEPVLVFESVMTVIRMYEVGDGYTAVATFGALVNNTQRQILASYPTVLLGYDPDGPGRKTTETLGDYLSDNTEVFIIPCQSGTKLDLADIEADEEIEHLIDDSEHYLEVMWQRK